MSRLFYFFIGRELCYLRIVGLRSEIFYEGIWPSVFYIHGDRSM
nr:MAG TPA: hypothetical protein [Caudoviricetes sp.]